MIARGAGTTIARSGVMSIRAVHPVVHHRRVTASILTALTLALCAALVVAWGAVALVLFVPALPVAFVLLWSSTGALRFDERDVIVTQPVLRVRRELPAHA